MGDDAVSVDGEGVVLQDFESGGGGGGDEGAGVEGAFEEGGRHCGGVGDGGGGKGRVGWDVTWEGWKCMRYLGGLARGEVGGN